MTRDSQQDRPDSDLTHFWQKIAVVAEIPSLCRRLDPEGATVVKVLRLVQTVVPFDAAMLYLLDQSGRRLVPHACIGEEVKLPSFLDQKHVDPGEGWHARSRKATLISGYGADPDFEPDRRFSSVMTVPLLVDDEVVGMLNLATYNPGVLEDRHVKLMSIVADQLAVAIERSSYIAVIEARNCDIRQAHDELKAAQGQIIAGAKAAAVAELAASINHEINNPLSVIVGHVQCLELELTSAPDKTRDRLKRIEEAAMRISDINRKLLNIETIVSETYLNDESMKMVNLEKSASS
jgi:GAF domain-containing protein